MYKISNRDISINHNLIVNAISSGKTAALFEEDFIKKSFPVIERDLDIKYPYEIKLPKTINDMLKGDFSPSRVIKIDGPIKGPWSNIWFGNSKKGIFLHGAGYVNGDSRYICTQKLDDADIHMILAGATGQGKSATLNAIIIGICMEYAPWEVNLTMCDAKIVEFKTYALKIPMPHIRSVAATGDADYLISVLSNLVHEMNQMNSVFTVAGVKNIKGFREITGLTIPQNIIIIDEFQTMFKYAKKRSGEILGLLDSFARLGRNTGYHLILASQELGSDIPKSMLGNIKVRGALGCFADVSTQILGNDGAAANYGTKGRLIINNQPSMENNKSLNTTVRVPFIDDKPLLDVGKYIIQVGNKFKLDHNMSFYDEQALIYEQDYKDYLSQFNLSKNSLYFGEPSFVMSGEQCVHIDFSGNDVENLLVLVNNATHLKRYFKMLKYNIELVKKQGITNIVLLADNIFSSCNPRSLVDSKSFYFEEKSFESKFFSIATGLVNRRRLCIAVDKSVFDLLQYNKTTDETFYQLYNAGSSMDTELFRSRCFYAIYLLENDESFSKAFKLDTLSGQKKFEQEKIILKMCLDMFDNYGCKDSKLTYDNLPMIYFWVLGLSKVLGIGRDSKSQKVTAFKKVLQDCSDVNIRFLMFTTTMEDMTDLISGIRYYLLDDVPSRELSKIKCGDDYPEQKSGGLGVFYDSMSNEPNSKCKKFKKMFLEGELPPTE